METASHAISFLLRWLWHASNIQTFSSNDFTGWYNSAQRMWYFSYWNNQTLRWYRFQWNIVQIWYGPCFTFCRKFGTFTSFCLSWFSFLWMPLVFLDFFGISLFYIVFVPLFSYSIFFFFFFTIFLVPCFLIYYFTFRIFLMSVLFI